MRITADVEVINLLLPSFNMKAKGRSAKGQLSVGKKPGHKEDGLYMMLCTKQNAAGSFFRLKDNVDKCFTKFATEGKATIRFHQPPNDVCIQKADPIQLKAFLNVVSQAVRGSNLDQLKLTPLAPVTQKQVDRWKTKLKIQDRKNYPITTDFPTCLETLVVNNINMKKIDSRIFRLSKLSSLNLSDNAIQFVPNMFDSLDHLTELTLCGNQITEIPKHFCSGKMQATLRLLDVRRNQIQFLPSYFCRLQALVTLKIDSNQLKCLPGDIGSMKQLKFFTASSNQIQVVPSSFRRLFLNELDLHNNPFLNPDTSGVIDRLSCPSLLESSARAIYKHRVPYSEEDVGPLLSFLSSAKLCLCGRHSFKNHVHYLTKLELSRVASTHTTLSPPHSNHIPLEAFLCSKKCWNRYQQNPNALIWK